MEPIREVDQPTSSRLTFDTPVRAKSTAKPTLSDLVEKGSTPSVTNDTTQDAYTTAKEDCNDTAQGKVASTDSPALYVTAVSATKQDEDDYGMYFMLLPPQFYLATSANLSTQSLAMMQPRKAR